MRITTRLLLILPALLLALTLPAQAQREVVTIDDAKARLLVSIIDNTTWPNEAAMNHFVLGVLGNDRTLVAALVSQMGGITIRGKSVKVKVYDSLKAAREANVLVLPQSRNSELADIGRTLQGSRTLLVTESAGNKAHIMVNFMFSSKVRLGFEINASNITNAGMTPSRELLLFGGSKVDLADIYEQSEAKLAEARAMAAEQQQQLNEQRELLAAQGDTIDRQRAEVASNQRKLAQLETHLEGVRESLADSQSRLDDNAAELEEKEQILLEKEAYIASYTERIERNLKRLEDQQLEIAEQERQIQEQSSVLVSQLSTIESQRFILIAIGAVLLLVLVLIGIILRAWRSKHRLALQLEGKTRELGVANEKLVQLTEAKSRFLSTMSHEIRTPMNGVVGMAELLEGTELTGQQREYVSLIIKSADTLLGLINDILDLSKIEVGRLDLESISFSLREVLADTLQTLALRANAKDLELTFHIPPGVPDWVLGDPLRLRQVVVNLVGNAIKFTEEGEIDLDLQLVSSDEKQVRIRFEVKDTGIGITPAQQEKIFQAFDQADASTTRRFGGTGLGLAISHQLVQLMGGELSVQSEPDQGSTFYFEADFAVSDEAAPLALQPEELRGLPALVVDDNATNRMILEEMLTNWGMAPCVVDGAGPALAALENAEQADKPFAIALLDVMMPDVDGFELTTMIRRLPAHQELRILMLTSAGSAISETQRKELAISRVLMKPVKHSDLLAAMTDALGVTQKSGEVTPAGSVGVAARKVLLVEDNPINRKVAMELLGRRGHQVEVASNGAEAVEAVANQTFDVVLMDQHMPVMDGLTATRTIREREQGSDRHVHIVALTAAATVEDRENSLAAGADGFVSKPFRAEALYQAVEGVAAEAGAEPGQPGTAAAATPAGDEQQPCLDWQGALHNLEGDEDFLFELTEMFLEQYPGMLDAVEDAAAAGDAPGLQRAAHALKGSSQLIGGRATAASALALENIGRSGDLSQAPPALQRLQQNLQRLKEALIAALPERET
ncbi:YfiR/HmsC family protein [Parahaliea maris]|uniref:YfiR/HmsC family protein n=1 Tax=Parahaliea maris TaxID=2716870 RepID=UPI0016503C0F|nr:YfiR/HmsC family protein [Parahaliea maris]